jgi:3-hydroxymyristoyl/3-hydroxydecanoyl-(acyl carrier protein) dehydratase
MRFLFVDRILRLTPKVSIQGLKHVTYDDFYLQQDDQGRHFFIPALMGECLGQLAAWNVMYSNEFTKRPVAGLTSSARVFRPVYVGETILLESIIDSIDEVAMQYHSVAYVGDEVVFTLDGALGPLLPMEDFIDQTLVRKQFNEINRPGDWSPLKKATTSPQKNSSASYPLAPLMKFDRILSLDPGVRVCAEKRMTRAASYFPDHFPNKPVLPLTVLLQCQMHLADEFVANAGFSKQYQVSELRKIKMKDFVYPGDVVVSTLSVKCHESNELVLTCCSEVNGKRVCVLDLIMTVKGD